MESLLKNVVRIDNNIHVIPFYKIPACDVGPDDRTDYILVGNYTGSRGHELLLEAWTRLQEKGRTPAAVELMIEEVKNFDMKFFLAFLKMIHEIDVDEVINFSKLEVDL